MLKISYAGCPGLSLVISAQFAFEMCLAAQNRKQYIRNLTLVFRSSKVIALGANRKPVYDFLLVINSNLNISHRY